MLCKLAWGNVRRAGRDYLVYLLTLTLGVTVFYAFNTIVDIAGIDEEGLAQVMGSMLGDLTYFLAGVMAFLMVYANNFIMKRRKKEFGLYQVLGMGRGRVATIMALETVIVSVVAFVAGIVLGVGLSQLMTFFTASLFKTQIANFHFFFSVHAFSLTLACMLVMFVLTLLLNLRAVRRTKLIELMGAERRNESIKTRNPWIAIAIFAVGVVLVGVAYYRLLRDGFPLTATDSKLQEAMNQFGITTAMVTVGTFALFWGLSGMLIKLLQSLRGVYWRGLNMFTVRQLAAKVNTVCFSMGVIAMLLFLAITSVTCGMSIANVMNENLERYNPVDVSQTYVYYTPDTLDYYKGYKGYVNPSEADRMVLADTTVDLYPAWHGKGKSADNNDETGKKVDIADVAGEHVQIDSYLSYPFGGSNPSVTPSEMCKTMGEKLPKAFGGSNADTMGLFVTPASQYNKLRQMMGEEPVSIGRDQYLLTCDMGGELVELYTKYMAGGHALTLGGHTLKPATDKSDEDTAAIANSAMGSNPGTVVVADELLSQLNLQPYSSSLLVNYKQGMDTTEADESIKYTLLDNLLVDGKEPGVWGTFITRSEMYTQAAQMNGLISYLAIYIGFVLVVACAAILSIQQLSNVADGSRSYRVLAQIGCDDRQIRHSVMAQQAVFFLFPLAVGLAHSFVALKVIIELVSIFGNMSIGGTVGLTCAIFLAAYGGYFLVTYLMSTGMVQAAIATRYSE